MTQEGVEGAAMADEAHVLACRPRTIAEGVTTCDVRVPGAQSATAPDTDEIDGVPVVDWHERSDR